jgi:hypothetical protein
VSGSVQVNLTSLPPVKVQVTPPAVVGVIVGAGVIALPGTSGGYTHTQAVASAVWTINHNLGFSPNVQARTVGGLNGGGESEVVVDLRAAHDRSLRGHRPTELRSILWPSPRTVTSIS